MKNVAATKGHRVNFADFLGEAIAREGNWAGRDNVLNFLSRPPSGDPRSLQPVTRSEFAKCRIRLFFCDARKICRKSKIFFDGHATPRSPELSRWPRTIDAQRMPVEESQKKKRGGGPGPLRFSGYCGFVPSVIFFA